MTTTPFERVRDRLSNFRPSGTHAGMASCPHPDHVRGDRNRSLSVKEADDSKVLLNCFMGHRAPEIVGSLGLTLSDLYPEDSVRVVREAHRLLRGGGHFSIWTPHRGHFLEVLKNRGILLEPDPSHVDYKSMARMRAMLEEGGFEIERAYYAESHLPGLRTVERALLPVIPLLRRRIAVLARKRDGDLDEGERT